MTELGNWWVLAGWALFLVASWPYSRRVKHPDTKAVAAYMMFILICAVVASGLFFLIMGGVIWAGQAALLEGPVAALIVGLASIVPAVLAGRFLIRRPPGKTPRPD